MKEEENGSTKPNATLRVATKLTDTISENVASLHEHHKTDIIMAVFMLETLKLSRESFNV